MDFSNVRYRKFLIVFPNIDNLNVDDVKRIDSEFGFIGIYKIDKSIRLYVELQQKRRIYHSRVIRFIKTLGFKNEIKVETFVRCEGECLYEEGSLRKRGRKVLVSNNEQLLKIPVINEEQDRLLPTPKKVNVAAPMRFFPVYTGYNRKWEIVSWFPETESIRRNTSSFRDILLEKQDHKCNYCDCIVNFGEYSNADVDHKIPLNCGGGSYIDNLQVLCVMCHRYKTALETKSRTMTKSIEEMGLE